MNESIRQELPHPPMSNVLWIKDCRFVHPSHVVFRRKSSSQEQDEIDRRAEYDQVSDRATKPGETELSRCISGHVLSFRWRWSATFRLGYHDQAPVSPGTHRAYAEDYVVFGFRQVYFGFRGTNHVLLRERWIAGSAPEHLIGGGSGGGIPLDLGIIFKFPGQQADLGRRSRRQSQ